VTGYPYPRRPDRFNCRLPGTLRQDASGSILATFINFSSGGFGATLSPDLSIDRTRPIEVQVGEDARAPTFFATVCKIEKKNKKYPGQQIVHCAQIGGLESGGPSDRSFTRTTQDALMRPRRYLSRVTESIEIRGIALRRRRVLELSKPDFDATWQVGDRFWLPLLVAERGRLVGNLSVRSGNGTSLRVANLSEHRQILVSAILSCLESKGVPTLAICGSDPLPDSDFELSRKLLVQIAKIVTDSEEGAKESRRQLESGWWRDLISTSDQLAHRLLSLVNSDKSVRYLLNVATDSYPIFAEAIVSTENRVVLDFEFDAPHWEQFSRGDPTSTRHGRPRLSFNAWIRRELGMRPANQLFCLGDVPSICGDFRFRMEAPRGFYRNQSIFLVEDKKTANTIESLALDFDRPGALEPENSEIVIPLASDTLHPHDLVSYVNMYYSDSGFLTRPGRQFYVSATFLERPPGTIGVALATSLVVALVLAALAIFFPELINPMKEASFEVPAILIAVPGVYALLMSPRQLERSITSRPLASFLGLAGTGFISLLAALDLVITGACDDRVVFYDAPWTISAGHLGLLIWRVLLGVQVLICVRIGTGYWKARRDFRRPSSGDDKRQYSRRSRHSSRNSR
jgi:hypothetical protein